MFGLDAEGVAKTRENYQPDAMIANDGDVGRVMQMLESGMFNPSEPGIFDMLTAGLRSPHDPWLTIADLRDFIDAQQRVNDAYQDQDRWTKMSIINTASSGWFSSDRTIDQYAKEIWDAKPMA